MNDMDVALIELAIGLVCNFIAVLVTYDKLSDKVEKIVPTVRNELEQTIKDNTMIVTETVKYTDKDIVEIDGKLHEIHNKLFDKLNDIDRTLAVKHTSQEYQYSNLKENQKEIYTKLVETENLVKDCKYDISKNI